MAVARRARNGGARVALGVVVAVVALAVLAPSDDRWRRRAPAGPAVAGLHAAAAPAPGADAGCLTCHEGIEEMHRWYPLSCTQCHGGDGQATTIERAHVPLDGWPADERVRAPGFDADAARFRNPSDLRVVDQTCGSCHAQLVDHLGKSLHGTTAGHLCDGLYENGIIDERESPYGIFAVRDDDGDFGEHGLPELAGIERLRIPRVRRDADPAGMLGSHFTDLPRKSCMQCHLYEQGVAMRGRLGQDGLYRGAGCAACHVSYAENGLSRSGDRSVDRFEPGHPMRHELTAAPPTETCVHCHVGDASIGNGFRGLAQLYPNQPAGTDVPGTTDRLIANQFFVQDPQLTPPDIHHSAGMHCIDCHTGRDVMGDGNIYGAMEHGVEIECVDCHGDFGRYTRMETSRGEPLEHIERVGEMFILRSKVDGRAHRIKQVKDVIDPDHPDFNPRAVPAMTADHAGLECYSCHSGWSTNFFGFHFDRNLGFSQLDLITGKRTDGRVTTQERVFATLRQLVLGVNSEGMIAPYMVGFSTMGTVRDADGGLLVDQGLPATANGMSGMTMVHHQMHTTLPTSRSCVECHRSAATYGLGTGGSYSLARGVAFVVGERGLDTLMIDRDNPGQSLYMARLPLGGARKVLVDSHVITGYAETAFVVIEHAGVALVDVRNPAFPRMRAFVSAGDARDAALAGDLLIVANGLGGVRVVDVSDRDQPVLVSDLRTTEARGLELQWPRVLVADGPGGLLAADLSVPGSPRIVGQLRLTAAGEDVDGDAEAVDAVFQYSRPQGSEERTPARLIAAVANGNYGVVLVDATEPSAMELLIGVGEQYRAAARVTDVTVTSRFDLGDTAGLEPTVERDVAYVLLAGRQAGGSLMLLDITDAARPAVLDSVGLRAQGGFVRGGTLAKSYNPPQLMSRYLAASEFEGLQVIDVTQSDGATLRERLTGVSDTFDVAVESFAFDRMVDETGNQLKDISHEGARYLSRQEIHRVLSLPAESLFLVDDGGRVRASIDDAFDGRAVPGGLTAAGRSRNAVDGQMASVREERLAGGFRLDARESLARMVRHVHPPDFDQGGDRALSRKELEKLFFAVLDANGDGELDPLEWPRHPGEDPGALDRNRDGELSRNEMKLGDDVFRFFDLDDNGRVAFAEWPWYIAEQPMPSFFYVENEALLEMLHSPGFFRRRPDFYESLFGVNTPSTDIDAARVQTLLDRARAQPLTDPTGQAAPPGFLGRWDLDGDGAVDGLEFPGLSRLAARCDLDGDGEISADDAP